MVMRPSIRRACLALLLLPFALPAQRPEPVGAQPPAACTFDTCSLRIEPRFFLGDVVVVANGREQRPLGFTGRTLVELTAGNEFAQREARLASRHRTRGGVISLVSTATWAALTVLWLNKSNREVGNGLFLGSTAALAVGGTWAGYHALKDHQHTARAVWAYNRDLAR